MTTYLDMINFKVTCFIAYLSVPHRKNLFFRLLLCAVVILAFISIPTEALAQDVIKPFDKSRVQAEFMKRCIKWDAIIRPSEYNPGSTYYSGYKKQKIIGSNIVGLYGLKEPAFFMFTNRNHPERMRNKGGIASESLLRLFEMTKGDFIVVYVHNTSMYAENIEGGLYTFDYQGNKIDSLLLFRSYHCSYEDHSYISYDLVSELNQDFSVKMTYIHWYRNEQITDPKTPYLITGTFFGQRFDEEHSLSSDGHFRITRRTTYSPKMYSPKDLRQYAVGSKINDPSWGIHHGTESVVRQETYNNVLSNSVSLYNGLGKVVKIKSADVIINDSLSDRLIVNDVLGAGKLNPEGKKPDADQPQSAGQKKSTIFYRNIVLEGRCGRTYVYPETLTLKEMQALFPDAIFEIPTDL
ncbi:MAG: hypothetical protein K6E86_08375 [Bacteroidales bacterium]|nr:hypothetical protein [Bacteroidales bacterium]